VETLSKNTFQFMEARIVNGNKGAQVGIICGLGETVA
jgi:hypothetical protein